MLSYRRLRHTYGFGVHSPLAYRLVKDVLRPGRVEWYGYDDIDRLLEHDCAGLPFGEGRRKARLLLRLAGFTGARTLWMPQTVGEEWHTLYSGAARAADSRIRLLASEVSPAEADLMVIDGSDISSESEANIARWLGMPGHTLLAFGMQPEQPRRVAATLGQGVALYGRTDLIALSRDMTAPALYSVIV